MAIVAAVGTAVVSYSYDPWGNILSATGTMADTLGSINPLRYRGYVYDEETGLYYLQSRYYNPTWGRFINADDVDCLGTGNNLTSYNLFAYCGNNPVMGYDPTGHWDWSWKDTLNLGLTIAVVGLAIIAAAPTGGGSLVVGGYILSSAAVVSTGTAVVATGATVVGGSLLEASIMAAKQSKKSGKEKGNDIPSYVSRNDVDPNKSSKENAKNIMDNQFGEGNWRTGPASDYSKIKKWIERSFIFLLL